MRLLVSLLHRKRRAAWFWSLLIGAIASATQGACSEPTRHYSFQPLAQVKAGYFFFSNPTMRTIYNRGGLDLQLSASYPLWNMAHRWNLHAYGAVEYLYKSGTSRSAHQKTELWQVPVNIGLKPVCAINKHIQYYFAAGPRYFHIHQHNHSSYIYKNQSRNGLGFFVNTGFTSILSDHFVVDIFGEYSYAKTHFHSKKPGVYTKSAQVGGFTFGGGIGYAF